MSVDIKIVNIDSQIKISFKTELARRFDIYRFGDINSDTFNMSMHSLNSGTAIGAAMNREEIETLMLACKKLLEQD